VVTRAAREGARRRRVVFADEPRTTRAAVDGALVLAIDCSGSISERRLSMQIQGYIDALRHPSFIATVHGGFLGRIAVTFVEQPLLAGPYAQERRGPSECIAAGGR
jgi:hypothetical protein